MGREASLGEFEQVVLLTVLQLGAGAYGPDLARYLEREVGRPVSRGALYATLGRLEEKGLLRYRVEAPGPDRGGHHRRLFEVTDGGIVALREQRIVLERLWSGLEGMLRSP
jgi:DNA-binding PadR family transcriptional regulator